MIVKFCGKCGVALRNDSVFCHHCGWKVLSAKFLKCIKKSSSESVSSPRKETEEEISQDDSSEEEKEKKAEKVRKPKENLGQSPIVESRSLSEKKTLKDIPGQKSSLRKGLHVGIIITVLLIIAGAIGGFFLLINKGWLTGLRISPASVATELNVRRSLILQGEKKGENDDIDGAATVTDMTKIVYFSERGAKTGLCDIFIMDADGSNVFNVTNNPDSDDRNPSLSPDSQRIVFSRVGEMRSEHYLLNADGSGLHNITNGPDSLDIGPCFPPDGKRIALTSERDGYSHIFIMNTNGTGISNITNNPTHYDGLPSF